MRVLIATIFGLSFFASTAWAQMEGDLLRDDEAYKVSAKIQSPGLAIVSFKIARDYYLYRGQMKFEVGDGVALGNITLPAGKHEHDEFLGDVVIYHGQVAATVPFTAAPGVGKIDLTVGYQGCHEVTPKLCYPPTSKTFVLTLPVGNQAQVGRSIKKTLRGMDARQASIAHTRAVGTQAADELLNSSTRYSGTAEAQAAVKVGMVAEQAGKFDDAIHDFKRAIMLDPNYREGQFQYIMTKRSKYSHALFLEHLHTAPATEEQLSAAVAKDKINIEKLIHEYESLAEKYPDRAIYPWVLGQFYYETDLARQRSYCERAAAIDPKFPQAWECLGHIASLTTHHERAMNYLQKAFELAPNDQEIAFLYADSLMAFGKPADRQIKSLVRRFPKSFAIANLLTRGADRIGSKADRIGALEKLFMDGLPGSPLASSAAAYLYSNYVDGDLLKARSLVHRMVNLDAKDGMWISRMRFVNGLIKAQHDIDAGRTEEAQADLNSISSLSGQHLASSNRWHLMEAKVLDTSGKTADAIALLRRQFVAQPMDSLLDALYAYGAKVRKSKHAVNDSIWAALEAKAKVAPPFTLERLDDDGTVSLADYRGKPVIVDFWYPNCAPCRVAFPYLQKVALKFKARGLTVLAINGIQDQQSFARSYLRGMGYKFLGLAGSRNGVVKAYGVVAYPTTFFVGPNDKILWAFRFFDDFDVQSGEAAVKFMLTRSRA